MPYRTQISPKRQTRDPAYIPLPHPTWGGDVRLADLAQPLRAADFWKRLGL